MSFLTEHNYIPMCLDEPSGSKKTIEFPVFKTTQTHDCNYVAESSISSAVTRLYLPIHRSVRFHPGSNFNFQFVLKEIKALIKNKTHRKRK